METEEAKAFIQEREAKLGGEILYKAYATWFAELGRERREFGVFLYSDGKTLVIEDFFRPGKILGYELGTKREEERRRNYVKLEIELPVQAIRRIEYVSRSSAERSLTTMEDKAKEATLFSRCFAKNCALVECGGRTFFLELPSFKALKEFIENNQEKAR